MEAGNEYGARVAQRAAEQMAGIRARVLGAPGWIEGAIASAPGRPDSIGHSSIQAWSAGPLFPAVIARVDRCYEPPEGRIAFTSWELHIGAFRESYVTREDAEAVARWACAGGQIIPERYAQLVRARPGRIAAVLGELPADRP